MKKIIAIFVMLFAGISLYAQTDSIEVKKPIYSVRHGFVSEETMKSSKADENSQKHLYQAGVAIQKSANFQYISLGTIVFSGAFIGSAVKVKNSGGKTALFVGGGIMAGVSLASLFASINFKDKAGREIRLSAGEVVYKF